MAREAQEPVEASDLTPADSSGSDGLQRMQEKLREFYGDRDWEKFQSLKDLAAGITIEAAELQELFLWRDAADSTDVLAERRHDVEAELADVLIHCLNFARLAGIDIESAVLAKVDANARKYPTATARGRVVPHRRTGKENAP